jgi:uncharacterized protein YodC (DUF2158 family)
METKESQNLQVGDIVRLSSGSPALTLTAIDEEQYCTLIGWQEGAAGACVLENIPAACIRKV